MTILTWCENCGEDMHQRGGKSCQYCDEEYCHDCIEDHELYCDENPNEDEGW